MISIDTNVLLRYLLQDDKVQSQKAKILIDGSVLILVTDIVLVETLWVLSGKRYSVDRAGLAVVIRALLSEPNIIFEDGQTVWRSLKDFKNARPVKVGGKNKTAGFSDVFIVNKARRIANEWQIALEGVYTFDVAALELPGTLLP